MPGAMRPLLSFLLGLLGMIYATQRRAACTSGCLDSSLQVRALRSVEKITRRSQKLSEKMVLFNSCRYDPGVHAN